jgi:hypothetical protein
LQRSWNPRSSGLKLTADSNACGVLTEVERGHAMNEITPAKFDTAVFLANAGLGRRIV